ncbi:MAG: carboxypeptidase-like regulatory domain-containing protein [Armatimonadetes bacterium]|nr:carboxypeptidase-like regulatory domain-containing protein [Armatimonadota bacterium]
MIRAFRVLVVLAIVLSVTSAHAATKRVQIVGDSWAALMWQHKSLRTAFTAMGVSGIEEDGTNTAIGGTTASYWMQPANLAVIGAQLNANPSIDCVNLVLGGNDVWNWRTSWTQARTNAMLDGVRDNLASICDYCLNVRPSIHVVIHGYDYLNLCDTATADPSGAAGKMWLLLGQPTPEQINRLFLGLESRKRDLTERSPRIHYVQCFGTAQVAGGTSSAAPGQWPNFSPFPGGNVTLPTPMQYMNGNDPIHLNQTGYNMICAVATEAFYKPYFQDTLNGLVKGKVTSSQAGNNPIAGASVATMDNSYSTTTASDGSYSLQMPPGTRTLRVCRSSYLPVESSVALSAGGNKTQDFSLVADSTPPDGVVSSRQEIQAVKKSVKIPLERTGH